MTDSVRGDGWWQAPDGTWHPPFERRTDARLSPAPGSSATAEAERLAALAAEHTEAASRWAQGAEGEQRTAERLADLGPDYVVLHDLHVPGSDANVDHLVIGPTGVFVVDSKAYSGTFTERAGTLWSGRQPIRREVDTVEFIGARVAEFLATRTTTVLCFTHAPLPRPVVHLGATTAVDLDQIDPFIRDRPAVLPTADVQRISRRAEALAVPVDRPAAGRAVSPALLPPPPPPQNRRQQQRTAANSGRRKKRKPSVIGLLVRAAISVVILAVVFPRIVRDVASGGRKSTSASTTSVARPAGPAVTLRFSCPAVGRGYTAAFVWPAGRPMTLTRIQVAAGSTELVKVFWSELDKPPVPLVGVRPGTSLALRSSDVARPFQQPAVVSSTAPATPC